MPVIIERDLVGNRQKPTAEDVSSKPSAITNHDLKSFAGCATKYGNGLESLSANKIFFHKEKSKTGLEFNFYSPVDLLYAFFVFTDFPKQI